MRTCDHETCEENVSVYAWQIGVRTGSGWKVYCPNHGEEAAALVPAPAEGDTVKVTWKPPPSKLLPPGGKPDKVEAKWRHCLEMQSCAFPRPFYELEDVRAAFKKYSDEARFLREFIGDF